MHGGMGKHLQHLRGDPAGQRGDNAGIGEKRNDGIHGKGPFKVLQAVILFSPPFFPLYHTAGKKASSTKKKIRNPYKILKYCKH
jgi:hypothetical protein